MKMGKDEDALAGIVLGILGLAAVAAMLEKKCSACGKSVIRGTSICPHCGSRI
jgi:uncharacterized Zn finger protein (UPF0148 family)